MNETHQIPPPAQKILSVLEQCPIVLRPYVEQLRTLIFQTAASNPEIGKLTETLKWGQISYLTEQTKSGTTLRLGWDTKSSQFASLFVHCQTSLVSTWRNFYEDQLTFIDNREMRLPVQAPLRIEPIAHCISMALTYHARKLS